MQARRPGKASEENRFGTVPFAPGRLATLWTMGGEGDRDRETASRTCFFFPLRRSARARDANRYRYFVTLVAEGASCIIRI